MSNKKIFNPQKKVLVTGGAGYIGSVLVPTLAKKGFRLCVLDVKKIHKTILESHRNNITYIQTDIRNVTPRIFKDISAVIHLAGVSAESSASKHPRLTQHVNTHATLELAKKAKRAGVERFVFASSSSVYDRGIMNEEGEKHEDSFVSPDGPYSVSKHQAEKGLLSLSDKNFSVVVLRKATVSGVSPKMRFDLVINAMVKSVLENGYLRVFTRGLQWRPIISIDDVAKAYYLALVQPQNKVAGHIFNIGYNNFLVKDLALLVKKTCSNYFSLNPKIIFEKGGRKGRSYRMKTEKAKKILQFTAKISIEDVILDLVKKFKKNI